jgi:hypothetical protein
MAEVERSLFTVGVFKDLAWAERGIEALKAQGFEPAALSFLAKATPEISAFIERVAGAAPDSLELPVLGTSAVRGELVAVLQGGERELARVGLAAAMRRAGFQPHDGLIFETLAGRGGILVAAHGAPRAADALAVLLNYGAGNASIGAWTGRV